MSAQRMADHPEPQVAKTPTPVDALRQMVRGYQITQAIYVAAKLGVADLLDGGPKDAVELAATTGADPGAVHRLMRGLASIGVFAQVEGGRFALAPMGALLRSGIPGSQREFVLLSGEWRWPFWGDLLYSVQTGLPAHDHVYGMEAYAYLNQHPDLGQMFHGGLIGTPRAESSGAVVAAYDFSAIGTLVDVGGGLGDLLAGILRAHPSMRGVLFDLPYSIGVARAFIESQGLANRCELIGGSFFEDIPARGDAFMLRAVMHNWDDEHAAAILRTCRRAMQPGNKLLMLDRVITDQAQDEGGGGTLIDVEMLAVGSGRERTQAEFTGLLAAAGFTLLRVLPTQSTFSIIEAVGA